MALFQSFFAGSGAEDGHPAPVPQKRAELLRLVYRERFWNLLTPNLLYAAFCVPAFLLCAFCLKAVFGYWENGEGTLEQILPLDYSRRGNSSSQTARPPELPQEQPQELQ